ncbi:MAG TPA: diguanylate cyclase [Fibrobacteria bacterium]|nr:diguanylate cyclase [Fibrobacteria bacterium]
MTIQASRLCRVAILSGQEGVEALRQELALRSSDEQWLLVVDGMERPSVPPGEILLVLSDQDAEAAWPWIADESSYSERLTLPRDFRSQDAGVIADWVQRFGRLHQERTSLRRLIDRFEERIKRDSGRVRMADLLQEANHRLQEQSVRDGLTGIPNRRRFEEQFDYLWGRSAGEGTSIALILTDIDFFKRLNDSLGHQEGDRCLQEVARKLESLVVGEDDLVARYGGEEFVVLLWNCDRARAAEMAEKLRVGIRDLAIKHPDHPAGVVTISLGVSCDVPSLTSSAEDFLHNADTLLYEAKSAGRDCWKMGPAVPSAVVD